MHPIQPCHCPVLSQELAPWRIVISLCFTFVVGGLWLVVHAMPFFRALAELLRQDVCSELRRRWQEGSLEPKALEIFRQRSLERNEVFTGIVAGFLSPAAVLTFGITRFDLFMVCIAGMYLLAAFVNRQVSLPNAVHEALHVFACLVFTIVPLFAETEQGFNNDMRSGQMLMLVFSLCIVSKRQIFLLNLTSFASQLITALLTPALAASDNFSTYVLFGVGSPILNCAVSFAIRWSMMSECAALLGERQASRSEEVVRSLLSMMCDAVVALKEDLTLRDPCPRLASLLLRPDIGKEPSPERKFTRYVAEEDALKFETFIEESVGEESSRCIHIRLVDTLGTRVRVQIFHTRMLDLDNAPNHILGIVEDTSQETGYMANPPQRESWEPRESQSSSMDHSSDSSGSESSQRSSDIGLSSWGRLGTLGLRLRTRLTWEILEESKAARTFFGFGTDPSPENFVERFSEPRRLVRWLVSNHSLACCGYSDQSRLRFGHVRFLNPTAGSVYEGIMSAKIVRFPEDQGPFDFQKEFVDLEVHIAAPNTMKKLAPLTKTRRSRKLEPAHFTTFGKSRLRL